MTKNIIEIAVNAKQADPIEIKTNLLAVGVFSDEQESNKLCRALDKKLDDAVSKIIKLGDFKGKSDTCAILYGQDKIGAERVLLVGLGDKEKASVNTIRKAALTAANKAVELRAGNVVLAVHQALTGKKLRPVDIGRALAEGVYCGGYRYDEFVTSTEDGRPKKLAVTIVDKNVNTVKKL